MGGKNNRGNKRRNMGGSNTDWETNRDRVQNPDGSWTSVRPSFNAMFEEYYKNQGIVPPEEWDLFMATLRRDLPSTFRITGSGQFARDLRVKLQNDFLSKMDVNSLLTDDGEVVQPPQCLDWYPDQLAWKMDATKMQIRKLPVYQRVHKWLMKESDAGGITRQEAVSMVPPLFLDVEPHHYVLDMCAAPGNKTVQLLEMLHRGPDLPTGLVVANDADFKRCSLLTHTTKRLASTSLVVTHHDAQNLPILTDPTTQQPILFDRILCDVPCTGDGTLRKAADLFTRWQYALGNGIHWLQVQIATHAIRLLAEGGMLVYSTCSFNPVENEAVVAEVLRRSQGAMELVDVSQQLTKLKRSPGLTTWRVRDRDGYYATFEEAAEKNAYKLDKSMFPAQDNEGMHLERCMRFLPHHQDTGGFFVCVLRKVKGLPAAGVSMNRGLSTASKPLSKDKEEQEAPVPPAVAPAPTATTTDAPPTTNPPPTSNPKKRERPLEQPKDSSKQNGVDPVIWVDDKALLDKIHSFYGVDFNVKLLNGCLLTRNAGDEATGGAKRLYCVNESIRRLLDAGKDRLRIIIAGVKIFERQALRGHQVEAAQAMAAQDADPERAVMCPHRIAQEGLPVLLPHMRRQEWQPTLEEWIRLLHERFVSLQMDKSGGGGEQEAEAEAKEAGAVPGRRRVPITDPKSVESIARCYPGCSVALLRDEDARALGFHTIDEYRASHENTALVAAAPPAMACWRGKSSMSVLISKVDGAVMLDRIMDRMREHGLGDRAEKALAMSKSLSGFANAAENKPVEEAREEEGGQEAEEDS